MNEQKFRKGIIYPANPVTERGQATKLSSHGSKLVYANGRTIVIRDLQDPGKHIVYTGHIQPTTVARISPTGYYCASADNVGNVRIWDIAGTENILKLETKPFSGQIKDLDWDAESKRIFAVGNGQNRFGHVFMFDTGSSAGDIVGHSKVVNAVSMRSKRPFRAVSASDDTQLCLYHGTPYKFDKLIKTHTRFVQDVRYAPSGDLFASVGADSKVFLYNGDNGEVLHDFGDGVHSGTIFGLAWTPDSTHFATASGDKTVKYFDAAQKKVVSSWTVGSDVLDQQCGITTIGENEIISLSLNGLLNVFDTRKGGEAARVLYGPTKGVTASTVDSSGTLYAGSYDGRIVSVTTNGTVQHVSGSGHSNHVSGIAACTGASKVYSIGYDDTLREASNSKFSSASLSTGGQPKGVAAGDGDIVFVATISKIEAVSGGRKVASLSPSYTPASIAVNGKTVAIGAEDNKVYLHLWDGSKLQQTGTLDVNRAAVTALAFSPDGSLIVAGDSSGKLILYDVAEKKMVTSRWGGHSARINSVAFHPSGKYAVSGSLDTNVMVWSVEKPLKNVKIANAGMGGVNIVEWVGESTVASAGADASVRTWEIVFPA